MLPLDRELLPKSEMTITAVFTANTTPAVQSPAPVEEVVTLILVHSPTDSLT